MPPRPGRSVIRKKKNGSAISNCTKNSCWLSVRSFDAWGSCAHIDLACSQPSGLATEIAAIAQSSATTTNSHRPVIQPRRAPAAVLSGWLERPLYSRAATKPAAQRTSGNSGGSNKPIATNATSVTPATTMLIKTAREFLNEIPELAGAGSGATAKGDAGAAPSGVSRLISSSY